MNNASNAAPACDFCKRGLSDSCLQETLSSENIILTFYVCDENCYSNLLKENHKMIHNYMLKESKPWWDESKIPLRGSLVFND